MEFYLRATRNDGGATIRGVRPHIIHALSGLTSTHPPSPIASDDDYTLYSVVIFRKVYDTFSQKCRENKCEVCLHNVASPAFTSFSRRYVLRDFQYSADLIEKEREELQTADTAEKELWVGDPIHGLLDP